MIVKIEKEFPDLTLLHLSDGRVIGVNSECIVVYENEDDLWDGGTKDRPTIQLRVES